MKKLGGYFDFIKDFLNLGANASKNFTLHECRAWRYWRLTGISRLARITLIEQIGFLDLPIGISRS